MCLSVHLLPTISESVSVSMAILDTDTPCAVLLWSEHRGDALQRFVQCLTSYQEATVTCAHVCALQLCWLQLRDTSACKLLAMGALLVGCIGVRRGHEKHRTDAEARRYPDLAVILHPCVYLIGCSTSSVYFSFWIANQACTWQT